jgi:hypothetical protein
MAAPENMDMESNQNAKIWFGIAVGAAVAIGIMLSRRKKSRWESARDMTRRVASRSGELGDVSREMVDRVGNIYQEGRKVVEDAIELWTRGRQLAGY